METATTKPIKRDPNLVPLSREHHFGLLFGWKIKQGLAKGASLDIMRDYVLYFWKNSLCQHFQDEEDLLLNILPENDPLKEQFLREHALLRELIDQVEAREQLSGLLFEALHILITEHIRFEERQFFPHLEQHANAEQLALIGKHLTEDHAHAEDNFQPEFWTKVKK